MAMPMPPLQAGGSALPPPTDQDPSMAGGSMPCPNCGASLTLTSQPSSDGSGGMPPSGEPDGDEDMATADSMEQRRGKPFKNKGNIAALVGQMKGQ